MKMWMSVLAAAVAAATAPADDKLPPLDAKEWVTKDGGLKVWDVKEGTGKEVGKYSTVEVHYTGWLTNGKVFDSSKKTGKPFETPLGRVVPGWQFGLPGMKVGGIRRLYIPGKLAYGSEGSGDLIPPNATLVFEVELLDVTKGATNSTTEEKPMADFALPPLDAKEWTKRPNGLQVWDVKEGTGAEAKPAGTVKVHYTGWLTDGKVFDSSKKRNEPIEFPLTGVIKGWGDGVPGMKVGGVRRLVIPPELGYGKRGAPGAIPPDATLVFEIELLDVRK